MKFIFGMQISIKVFYQLIWVPLPRYAQSTQNKKSNLLIVHIFAIYPEKRGDDVDFLPADKRKSFLRVDSITLGVRSQECCTQSNKFAISVQ